MSIQFNNNNLLVHRWYTMNDDNRKMCGKSSAGRAASTTIITFTSSSASESGQLKRNSRNWTTLNTFRFLNNFRNTEKLLKFGISISVSRPTCQKNGELARRIFRFFHSSSSASASSSSSTACRYRWVIIIISTSQTMAWYKFVWKM